MARIPDLGRRLLALRSYLRAGSTLPERWSWSEQEIREFEQSQEFCDAQAEVDRVVAAFAAAYPGYTLVRQSGGPQPRRPDRALEQQRVGRCSFAGRCSTICVRASAQRAPGKGADWLQDSLTSWTLAVPVTLAAPGLSAHGQSRAFDFQVERDGTIVAGTEAEHATRDWDAAGWTERLKQIVARASTRLRGPLETPREPWHYYYDAGVSAPTETVHGPCE